MRPVSRYNEELEDTFEVRWQKLMNSTMIALSAVSLPLCYHFQSFGCFVGVSGEPRKLSQLCSYSHKVTFFSFPQAFGIASL